MTSNGNNNNNNAAPRPRPRPHNTQHTTNDHDHDHDVRHHDHDHDHDQVHPTKLSTTELHHTRQGSRTSKGRVQQNWSERREGSRGQQGLETASRAHGMFFFIIFTSFFSYSLHRGPETHLGPLYSYLSSFSSPGCHKRAQTMCLASFGPLVSYFYYFHFLTILTIIFNVFSFYQWPKRRVSRHLDH
jgi:hypothetical protein